MSAAADKIGELAAPQLEELAGGLADSFLDGLKEILNDSTDTTKDKVSAILKEGAQFKYKAITAKSAEEAREYAEAVETSTRRVKTILLAEQLVAQENVASMVADLWDQALTGLGVIAKGLLTTVIEGVVKGAIAGFTGGEAGGGDLSGIFPFSK